MECFEFYLLLYELFFSLPENNNKGDINVFCHDTYNI